MPIISPLLGEDFNIEKDHTYITRLLINDDIWHSRIKITFLQNLIYPFEFFVRNADEDGKAIIGSPIFRELVNYPDTNFVITIPKYETLLLIFSFNTALLPDDPNNFNLIYDVQYLPVGNQIVTDMYMFETVNGIPYRPYSMGSYSEFEFTEKIPWKGHSDYLGKTAVSKIVIGHSHENERGYIDRVYVLPKRGKIHGSHSVKNRGWNDKEESYIYLDPLQNTKQITSASNNVIRGLMFKTSDVPSKYGQIVFKFFTKNDLGETIYLKNSDERNGVIMAICKAPNTILYKGTSYGLSKEFSLNPQTIKLEQDESYKEGLFQYFSVSGNFAFTFKGQSNTISGAVIDIDPKRVEFLNVPSATYNAPTIIIGQDENGQQCTWYLVAVNPNVTLLPQFNYEQQNFTMESNNFIEHKFFYALLKNYFNVTAVFNNNIIKIIQICYETYGASLQLKHFSETVADNALNTYVIEEKIKFPANFPNLIFKYDDNITFPHIKYAEAPPEKTQNISIKYKCLLAYFKYIFCNKDNTNMIFNTITKGLASIDIFDKLNIPLKQQDLITGFNYEYYGYNDLSQAQITIGMPTNNIYTESENGDETFIYKFLYEVIKGQLKVTLIDEYDQLLNLTDFTYNNNIINQSNPHITNLLPNPSYTILTPLIKPEDGFYVAETVGTLSYIAEIQNEIQEKTIMYKRILNKFRIIAVNKTNDNQIEILEEINESYLNYPFTNIPIFINYPIMFPNQKFKYDDNIVFPIIKYAELPKDKIINIFVKYKELLAKFIYEYIDKDNNETLQPNFEVIKTKYTYPIVNISNIIKDTYHYKYWGYEVSYKNITATNGLPASSDILGDETQLGGEEFKYKLLYELLQGYLKVSLVDAAGQLLDLNGLLYNNTDISSYNNPYTTSLSPNPTYEIMSPLVITENMVYEANPTGTISHIITQPGSPIIEKTVVYTKKIINPLVKLIFDPMPGCHISKWYRGCIINKDTYKVVLNIRILGGYWIPRGAEIGDGYSDPIEIFINYNNVPGLTINKVGNILYIETDITTNYTEKYEFYYWNFYSSWCSGGHDPYSIRFESVNALDTIVKEWNSDKYFIHKQEQEPPLDSTWIPPSGVEPQISIDTSKKTTNTVFTFSNKSYEHIDNPESFYKL